MNNIFEKMEEIVSKNVRYYGKNYFDIDRQCIEVNDKNIFFWATNEYGTNIITEKQIIDVMDYYFNRKDSPKGWATKNLIDWYSAMVDNLTRNNKQFFFFNGKDLQEVSIYEFTDEFHLFYSRIYNIKTNYRKNFTVSFA